MTTKRPHRVAVLGLPSLIPLELGIATEVFGRDPRYEVTVCAEGGVARGVGPGITVTTPAGLKVLPQADTVIVPGYEDLDATLSAAVLDALRLAHGRGARLVSICTGAFAVAAAGLLDRRPATTHWLWTDELQRRHPLVEVLPNRLFVDDGDILTSAGMTTGIDLCLHLIRRDHGAAAANSAARVLVAPPQRQGGQAQFVERLRAEVTGDQLGPLRDWMLENLALPLDLDTLAGRAHMSRRTLTRRFREETPHGPGRAGICSSGLPSAHRHLAEGIPGSLPPRRTHIGVINTQAPSQQRRTGYQGALFVGKTPFGLRRQLLDTQGDHYQAGI
jgi:transcriptional regulator GlxA family with amidase domain